MGSVRQKRAAGKAAERLRGVVVVNNELGVRIRTEHRRRDADLRNDVLQALAVEPGSTLVSAHARAQQRSSMS